MKAERRHELKQNTLARGLETLPDVGRRHGTKVLVVLVIGLLVALLIRQRVTSARAAADSAAHALSHGREMIQQLHDASERVPATQLSAVAQDISKGVDTAVQQVLESTDDPRMLAEARLVRGDLHWHLANIPDLPEGTTRPANAKTDDQLLQAAAEAYQAVLETPSAPKESIVTARLSLAAVAENRRQWDQARLQYQNVVDDGSAPKPLKDLAAEALSRLQTIQRPPLIARPTTMMGDLGLGGVELPSTTRASTGPATTQAGATQPGTTQPGGTQPVGATQPGESSPATTPAAPTPPLVSPEAEEAKPQAAPQNPPQPG